MVTYHSGRRIQGNISSHKIHTFTTTGNSTFQITSGNGNVEYLVIAGGAGGGSGGAGGAGGGGGGAGAGGSQNGGGAGGSGLQSSINGTATYYAGGGGGGVWQATGVTGGAGGSSLGGAGGNYNSGGSDATGYGSGGGGGGVTGTSSQPSFAGGDGSQGIVILRYNPAEITATGGTITEADGKDIKPTNVQVGSRYEETDTRKIYYRDGLDFKELGEAPNYRSESWYEQLLGESP